MIRRQPRTMEGAAGSATLASAATQEIDFFDGPDAPVVTRDADILDAPDGTDLPTSIESEVVQVEAPAEEIAVAQTTPVRVIPQPDANGCFSTPADGAKFYASKGISQVPLSGPTDTRFNNPGKNPAIGGKGWQNKASTDPAQIDAWALQFPGCNFGSVAKHEVGADYSLECDSPLPLEEYKALSGENGFGARLVTKSSSGYHYWFKHDEKSIALITNIGQTEDFSLREHNEQCVTAGSVHKTGVQYSVFVNGSPAPASDKLLGWFQAKKKQSQTPATPATPAKGLIPHGQIHAWMRKKAGELHAKGLVQEEIEAPLLRLVHEYCEPPIDEQKVLEMARSICALYPAGKDDTVLIGGKIVGVDSDELPQTTEEAAKWNAALEASRELEVDRSPVAEKPTFPDWVMKGTSLYRNLCEPAIATSTKLPHLIFMPTMGAYLNYLSTRVSIKGVNHIPLTINMGLIACPGTFKSSCVELGFQFLKLAGITNDYSINLMLNVGEKKQLLFTVGSTEGLGLAMNGVGCTNAILYYDELRKAVKKMNIDGSSFSGDLLTLYEAGKFSNIVKDPKRSFTLEAGTYCVSWIFCCTRKAFDESWPKVMGTNTDLNDRMFFVLGPEKVGEGADSTLYTDPNLLEGAQRTYELILRALEKKEYEYEDVPAAQKMLSEGLKGLSVSDAVDGGDALDLSMSRLVNLAQKLALFFAVDLGRDAIDEDCLKRAVALVQYRVAAIRYLRPIEADTPLGRLQQQMLHVLRSNRGQMSTWLWEKLCNYSRHDTEIWHRAKKGLIITGRIRFEDVKAPSGQTRKVISLLKRGGAGNEQMD